MDMMYSFVITMFMYLFFKIDKLHKKNTNLIKSYEKKLEKMEYSFELSLENMNKYIMKTVPKDEYTTHKKFTREIFNLNDRFTMIQRDLETFKKNQIEYNNILEGDINQGILWATGGGYGHRGYQTCWAKYKKENNLTKKTEFLKSALDADSDNDLEPEVPDTIDQEIEEKNI